MTSMANLCEVVDSIRDKYLDTVVVRPILSCISNMLTSRRDQTDTAFLLWMGTGTCSSYFYLETAVFLIRFGGPQLRKLYFIYFLNMYVPINAVWRGTEVT
jgi:hypothetical protein